MIILVRWRCDGNDCANEGESSSPDAVPQNWHRLTDTRALCGNCMGDVYRKRFCRHPTKDRQWCGLTLPCPDHQN